VEQTIGVDGTNDRLGVDEPLPAAGGRPGRRDVPVRRVETTGGVDSDEPIAPLWVRSFHFGERTWAPERLRSDMPFSWQSYAVAHLNLVRFPRPLRQLLHFSIRSRKLVQRAKRRIGRRLGPSA